MILKRYAGYIAALKKRMDEMEDPRRLSVVLLLFMVVFLLWFFLIHENLEKYVQHESIAKKTAERKIVEIHQSTRELKKRLADQAIREKRTQVHLSKQKAAQRLFPTPERFRNILTELVNTPSGVRVTEIKVGQGQPLSAGQSIKGLPGGPSQYLQVPVLVHVGGGWENVYRFASGLAGMNWYIHWELLDYQVKKYPEAEVVLQFNVLRKASG